MTEMNATPAVDPTIPSHEGRASFDVGEETLQTWYRVFGDLASGTKPPLVVLHGGPGLIHDYMLPISDLAKSGQRAVIFYDQVGNGRSTRLRTKPVEFFTIEFFVAELENLVQKLGIASRFDVLGHSWGGILGLEYLARRQPPGLRRFVCSSTPACMARFYTEFPRLLSAFPKWVQEGMGMKKTDMARFRAANEAFDAVHTLTVVPFPKEHVDSMDSIWGPDADDTVGNALFASELKNWSIEDSLDRVTVPVFLINGRADKVTDYMVEPLFFGLPHVRWITMDGSSHMPFWEERTRFMELVDQWLRVE